MKNVLRAGLYERVSTDEQALHGYSIATQKDTLEEHCKEKGYKIVAHYTDEGISGAKPPLKRPALKQLLDDVQAGKIDVIIFTKLDRWFRSIEQYYKVQEILDKHNVPWQAVLEDYNTATADGRLKVNIMLSVAANERERTSERIKVVMQNKFKNKEAAWGGPRRALGYKIEKDENGIPRLVKDPETQHIIEEFWEMLIKHHTLHATGKHLNQVYGLNRTLRAWYGTRTSTLYCGEYNGIQDFCEPYISKEMWLRINSQPQIKKSPTSNIFYFTGLLRCPCCGNRLVVNSTKSKYGFYKAYRCANARAGICEFHKSRNEQKLEAWMLDHLEEMIKSEIEKIEIKKAKPKAKPKTDGAKLKEQLRKLNVIYMNGTIDDDEYLEQSNKLKALIEKASKEEPKEERDISHLKDFIQTDFRGIYANLTDEEKRRFWRDIIKEVHFDKEANVSHIVFW